MSYEIKKYQTNIETYLPIVLLDFYLLKSTLWLQILSCENDDVLFCTPKYIHNFYERGPVHSYNDIYKLCWYSMNYIMLIQYELQYDGTLSVTYYYSLTTIWSFIDYGCELILISIHKINNLRIRF